jgi:hypothetical protein
MAAELSLDANCIVAAQASEMTGLGDVLTIATKNPRHQKGGNDGEQESDNQSAGGSRDN